jgi:hypothetical protein
MFKAMALKELRETRGIILLALAAYSLLLVANLFSTTLTWRRLAPFVDDGFILVIALLFAAMTIALGLRQTLGESLRGTYPFLLHRPTGRNWLIGTKMFVGSVAYLVCSAVPLLAYGFWAATPGHHASPFQWSMTLPSWEVWFSMTLLYLGAFLSGIRPGRWIGSRLLPLVAAILVVFLVEVPARETFVAETLLGELSWRLPFILAADAAMIAGVFYVIRTRDF